jgi:pimeloyl-ACP methyl ester carboxylesterase
MTRRSKFIVGAAVVLLVVYLSGSVAAGIMLAEYTLHVHRRPVSNRTAFASIIHQQFGAKLRDIAVNAHDGAELRGWAAQPTGDNGDTVILLHGVTDNREGVAGYSRMFLQTGYRVILPDSRAHGESGGSIATYGLLERDDVHRWAEWARRQPGSHCVFLFGESMGAAIALQAAAADSQICAVAVESPYATFREIAFDRFARHSGLPFVLVEVIGDPTLEAALLYTRKKYGIDLRQSSPKYCINATTVPMLLITDTKDRNIPERHTKELMAIASSHASFWEVQGADHGGAVNIEPELFRTKVLGWYAMHRRN